jgi:competence protein ComEA
MTQNQFEFSKRSRKAILFFVVLFIVITIIPRLISISKKPSEFVFTQTDFEKKEFKKNKYQFSKNNYYKSKFNKKSRFKRPDKKFDPNKYAPSDWMKLGMSQKQADLIIRFGKRGFYSDDDLRKVFVISDEFFNLIRDSLYYPEKTKVESPKFEVEKKKFVLELNLASEEELVSIPGIGSYFAKNIIKRRDALGGFINKKQLLEVWKMDEEKLTAMEEYISIDPSLIRPIDLNNATAEELKKNPYFNWNIANSIVKMRNQLGGFSKIEDIKRSVLVDDEFFNKVKPYLTL